jgi:hypothetical protein
MATAVAAKPPAKTERTYASESGSRTRVWAANNLTGTLFSSVGTT